jgi:hypothetical protein
MIPENHLVIILDKANAMKAIAERTIVLVNSFDAALEQDILDRADARAIQDAFEIIEQCFNEMESDLTAMTVQLDFIDQYV